MTAIEPNWCVSLSWITCGRPGARRIGVGATDQPCDDQRPFDFHPSGVCIVTRKGSVTPTTAPLMPDRFAAGG
ncbi:MAG: hypothetical protein HZB53_01020 [Chloroflexi bacterium]|nr:hypothetical protein [Chloroflexota bacterium]